MKYRFLILMLCVSGNAFACQTLKWNTTKIYDNADSVFVGYISSVSVPEFEASAIQDVFNKPYTSEFTRFSNFKYIAPPLTGQTTDYILQVIPFAPFKSKQPLPESIRLTVIGGCSNNDTPEVDSIGLFYINQSEVAFIEKSKHSMYDNLPDSYEEQIATVKRLSHFVEIK